jgi:hypothetical protein
LGDAVAFKENQDKPGDQVTDLSSLAQTKKPPRFRVEMSFCCALL